MGFPGSLAVKMPSLQEMEEMWVHFLDWEDPLEEKEMATHCNILAWEIPWTEESGGLVGGGHKEWDITEHFFYIQKLSKSNKVNHNENRRNETVTVKNRNKWK